METGPRTENSMRYSKEQEFEILYYSSPYRVMKVLGAIFIGILSLMTGVILGSVALGIVASIPLCIVVYKIIDVVGKSFIEKQIYN